LKRLLFNVLTVASLVLTAGLLLAWAAGPWGYTHRTPRWIFGGGAWYVASRAGSLRVVRQAVSGTPTPDAIPFAGPLGAWNVRDRNGGLRYGGRFGPEELRHRALGFGWDHRLYTYRTLTMDYREWAAPYWFLLLVAGAAPALRLRAWVRTSRREVEGMCPRCGYDLRAEDDASGALLPRCPECGLAEGEA
jgi:hypothetical protein